MFGNFLKKMFGTQNERILDRIRPTVDRVNALESSVSPLSDDRLAAKIAEFRQRVENGEPLDDLLPETFAVVREAGKRVLDMRPFDVQLMGGVILHEGRIAEMRTGEGKTLAATLPIVLNALTGRGVHLVTVNDYLARRDAEWMGRLYRALGMSVGVIVHGMDDTERQASYRCDITYGTNNEFGFDYLRDNMKFRVEDMVQRDLHYAIVDEVDSILIDEARTPLIISGPAEESTSFYARVNSVIPFLKKDTDFTVDEKARQVLLTEDAGIPKLERLLSVDNLYDPGNIEVLHHVNQALKAHILFHRDVDYMVKDGEVVIVDEFTGRLMPGRRWSDGLHQAVEAKEGVQVKGETQTLATITIQNYFRMFDKLAGMTGTAETEEQEFYSIYGLEVNVIPTNKPARRLDKPDRIYRTRREKYNAVVEEVDRLHQLGLPALIGTTSVEVSETLSKMIRRQGVRHEVLNAKYHQREAEIVAGAGQKDAVTIATNMAGRGTDIKLGKDLDLTAAEAGLQIIGTERHESRRIDRQLRGRSGRQGDPGASLFFLSLEDDLMRLFGSDRIARYMEKSGVEEGEVITGRLVSAAIESAQKRVELQNFQSRKRLLEYDDVMNQQREVVYSLRLFALERGEELKAEARRMIGSALENAVRKYLGGTEKPEDWDREGLLAAVTLQYMVVPDAVTDAAATPNRNAVVGRVQAEGEAAFTRKVDYLKEFGRSIGVMDVDLQVLSQVMLSVLDEKWKDHLYDLDLLRNAIQYRAYGQKDPLVEYKREAYEMFEDLMRDVHSTFTERYLKVQVNVEPPRPAPPPRQMPAPERGPSADDLFTGAPPAQRMPRPATVTTSLGRMPTGPMPGAPVGRNDPCPCGSGKKYKKCHGAGV